MFKKIKAIFKRKEKELYEKAVLEANKDIAEELYEIMQAKKQALLKEVKREKRIESIKEFLKFFAVPTLIIGVPLIFAFYIAPTAISQISTENPETINLTKLIIDALPVLVPLSLIVLILRTIIERW